MDREHRVTAPCMAAYTLGGWYEKLSEGRHTWHTCNSCLCSHEALLPYVDIVSNLDLEKIDVTITGAKACKGEKPPLKSGEDVSKENFSLTDS